MYVADCLSRNPVQDRDEPDDPIAGRLPKGLDAREEEDRKFAAEPYEERDFERKFAPAAAAFTQEAMVAAGEADGVAVAEVVITEISPYDLNTPTTFITFMCEYNFNDELAVVVPTFPEASLEASVVVSCGCFWTFLGPLRFVCERWLSAQRRSARSSAVPVAPLARLLRRCARRSRRSLALIWIRWN